MCVWTAGRNAEVDNIMICPPGALRPGSPTGAYSRGPAGQEVGGQKIEASEQHDLDWLLSRQLGISIQKGIVSTRLQMGSMAGKLVRMHERQGSWARCRCRCPLLLCALETRTGVGTLGTVGMLG